MNLYNINMIRGVRFRKEDNIFLSIGNVIT